MKKVLVTGGAGFIGSQTVKDLLSNGYEVVVVDSLETGGRENLLSPHFYEGDFADIELLRRMFKEHNIEGVVHFAASIEAGKSVEDPSSFLHNNVVKTLVLLDEMVRASIKNLIFSSSAAVYGEPQRLPVDEEHPLNPENPYGLTKKMGEEILDAFTAAHGINSISLRYFNAAGVDPEGKLGPRYKEFTHAIPLAVMASLNDKPFYIFGTDYDTPDGTAIRDYVHVVDLARAHMLALDQLFEADAPSHDIYNLGTGTGTSVREMVEAVERLVGPIKTVDSPRRPGDAPHNVASFDKAKRELNWEPKLMLDNIVLDTANFFRNKSKVSV